MFSSNSNTRSGNKIWLLEEYLPTRDVDTDRIIFLGTSPPTVKDVFMNCKGQHAKLQEETKRQSKARQAAEQTVSEVKHWWMRTGVDLKSDQGLIKMILGLHDTYQALLKHKKRFSEKELKSRKQFLDDCKQIFWAVSKNFELKATTSSNPVLSEDNQWLQALKDPSRHTSIGPKDIKTAKKIKRKVSGRNKELEKKNENPIEKCASVEMNVTESEESKDENEQDDENFEPSCSNQPVAKRRSLLNSKVCQVADKYQISHRALTEIVFAGNVTNESSSQVSEVTVSVMTCKRQRDAVRSAAGSKIQHSIEQSIKAPDSLFLLQWDGKLLKGLQHTSKSVEHVAIILHSLNNPTSDTILSITGLYDKSSTAENEASLIQDELRNYPAIKNKIIGFCFDTTAVNTGLAMVL